MARYDFRCPEGHIIEHVCGMADCPVTIQCPQHYGVCIRLFEPPAAFHFKGPGFYQTDVKSRFERKRRKNATDGDYLEHDPFAEMARKT